MVSWNTNSKVGSAGYVACCKVRSVIWGKEMDSFREVLEGEEFTFYKPLLDE